MALRRYQPLVMAVFVALSACQNTDPRQKISTGNRSSNKSQVDSKLDKILGKNGCLQLDELANMLREGQSEVTQVATTDVSLLSGTADLSKAPEMDPTLIARLLNSTSEVSLSADVVPMAKLQDRFDILNVVNQLDCTRVDVKGTDGKLKTYLIDQPKMSTVTRTVKETVKEKDKQGKTIERQQTSTRRGSSGTRLVARTADGTSVVKIDVRRSGRIVITATQGLVEDKSCGVTKSLFLTTTNEISFRGSLDTPISVGASLAQVLNGHTEVSKTFSDLYAQSQKNAIQAPGRDRAAGNSLRTTFSVLEDAYSRAQKGQFKNLTCGNGKQPGGNSVPNPTPQKP